MSNEISYLSQKLTEIEKYETFIKIVYNAAIVSSPRQKQNHIISLLHQFGGQALAQTPSNFVKMLIGNFVKQVQVNTLLNTNKSAQTLNAF